MVCINFSIQNNTAAQIYVCRAKMAMERQHSVSSIASVASAQQDFNHLDIHVNCPEKVILCIDLAHEISTTTVKTKDRGELTLLSVWKSALTLFIWNKHLINKDHQFAVVIVGKEAQWFCDFTHSPQDACNVISQLETLGEDFDSFDTASLFSIIYENCCPPPPTDNPSLPPPYTVRAILLYGRSLSMPVYRGDVTAHDELIGNPYFFLDILYAHAPPGPSNMCKGIFDILSDMYPNPKALVLDWSFSITQLFNCFAKLLAHPLQRPLQYKMDHKLLTS